MVDKAKEAIVSIHSVHDRIASPIVYVVGKLEKNKHDRYPRIEWEYGTGSFEEPQNIGGIGGSVATDLQEFRLTVWHADRESCRTTLHNLMAAARKACYGPNVVWGTYEWIQEAHSNSGMKLAIDVQLKLQVPLEAVPVAEVKAHEHEVSVNGEVIC